jgi:integrase
MKRRPGDNRYLLRQDQTWSVVVEVPPSLRPILGRRLKKTLGTRDVFLARAKRWRVVAELKECIAAARRGSGLSEAMAYREEMEHALRLPGGDDDPDASPVALVGDAIVDRAEAIEREQGYAEAKAFADIALARATPIALYVDAWLSEGSLGGAPLKPRTKLERQRTIERLVNWLEHEKLAPTVEAVTRRVAGRFVSQELLPTGRAPITLAKHVQSLSNYWRWLQKRGHVSDEMADPWARQAPRKGSPTVNSIDAERPFTDDEIRRLLASSPDATMGDFIKMAALTGMGREEIGRLTVADCAGGVFVVRSGKTAAAARRVPIHSALSLMVETRLKGKPTDAYLFHELRSGTFDRTDPLGKAFTRYRRSLGIQEGTGRRSMVNFHSFRRWFVTTAINAGCVPHMVSLVVGHSEGREGMTKGRYWAGADDDKLRQVVEAVRLPDLTTAGSPHRRAATGTEIAATPAGSPEKSAAVSTDSL